MQRDFRHSGKYTGEDFSLDEVIKSLAAQQVLLETSIDFISSLDKSMKVEKVSIRIVSLETDSLFWDLMITVYANYQTQVEEKVVGTLEPMFGVDIPPKLEGLVTLGALAVTYAVARYAYDRVSRSKGEKSGSAIHIEGNHNIVIQNIGKITDTDVETVRRLLDKALPSATQRKLIPSVADFLRPAKKKRGEKIEFANAPDISSEALTEFPSDAELEAVDGYKMISINEAHLDIRGTDRDRANKGWGALISDDDRFPRRMPMKLYPDVDPEELAQHRYVQAHVSVGCEVDSNGSLSGKRIYLISFSPIQPEGGTAANPSPEAGA